MLFKHFLKTWAIAFFILIFTHSLYAMEVAITIDDLPMQGDLPPNTTRLDIAKNIINVLKKHHIQGVYGFINAEKIQQHPQSYKVLKEWVNQGYFLGNHTFSHVDLAKVSSEAFIQDIKNNQAILMQLMGDKDDYYFRYPFLAEGNTSQKREAVRQFLFQNHYHIAEVTTDFFEYEWADPYVRCLKKHDKQSIQWLKESYIEQSLNALIISHELAMMMFNRDVKNILLIHINAFTATMLDALLTAYEKKGVKFISLDDALRDEIYKMNPDILKDRSYTFLNQIRLSKGLENPDQVKALYDSLPEEKLKTICR